LSLRRFARFLLLVCGHLVGEHPQVSPKVKTNVQSPLGQYQSIALACKKDFKLF
jgi:hypothetical protein